MLCSCQYSECASTRCSIGEFYCNGQCVASLSECQDGCGAGLVRCLDFTCAAPGECYVPRYGRSIKSYHQYLRSFTSNLHEYQVFDSEGEVSFNTISNSRLQRI